MALTVIVIVLIVLGLVALASYLGLANSSNGTLSIGIMDSPIQNVSHIYLTISNIMLQGNGNSTVAYNNGQVQFDLLSLVNVTRILGNVSIHSGNYTMIRFTIISAVATIAGSNLTLKVPSGEIKVLFATPLKSSPVRLQA